MKVPDTAPKTPDDWMHRIFETQEVFSPGAPIDDLNLLAGRTKQVTQMLETVLQRGQHAILYGERGVGKSSLANTFSTKLLAPTRVVNIIQVNCDPSDDFTRLWRKVFRRLDVGDEKLSSKYSNEIFPDDVVYELSNFSLTTTAIIVLDEFDQLQDADARALVANTIKNLSDRSARVTVILVGVADSVATLIESHESIARCLRQIHMQRMFPSELREIVTVRLPKIGMSIDDDALAYIVSLSRGLPHYTHLIGQQAAVKALDITTLRVALEHVDAALPYCIEKTAQTVQQRYHQATHSPRQGNIYKEVLLAAALAAVDDLGYFPPIALRKPLTALLGRDAPVSLFGQHLKILCEADRGPILQQTGAERRFRYRFVEPMMQPYVLMDGLRKGRISRQQIAELAATHYEPRLFDDF